MNLDRLRKRVRQYIDQVIKQYMIHFWVSVSLANASLGASLPSMETDRHGLPVLLA